MEDPVDQTEAQQTGEADQAEAAGEATSGAEAVAEQAPEAAGAAPAGSPITSTKRWYVVHAYSGFEKNVARTLQERVELSNHWSALTFFENWAS